jgi:drug/metabolite transporter (DMT)-like permease
MTFPPLSRNNLLFLLMCLVWGLTWLPVKIGAGIVPPIFLAAARFLIAGVLMLAWAGRDAVLVPRVAWPRLILTAAFINTANYALLFWGVLQAPTGLSAIVNFAMIPIVSMLAGRVLGDEYLDWARIGAILLGVCGLGLLFATRAQGGFANLAGHRELLGLGAILLGTIFYCVGAVLARQISSTMPTLTLAGWQTLIGGIGLAVVSGLLEPIGADDFHALVRWPVLPSLAFLVAGGSLIGFTVYMRLLRDWGPFRAGLYAFVSPAIAVSTGIVVLGEPFGWSEGVGAVIMFAAAAMALRKR